MQYFNFRRLITKYMCNFTLKKPSKGSYVGGQYQQGSIEEIELTGAILSMTATKLYQSGVIDYDNALDYCLDKADMEKKIMPPPGTPRRNAMI